MNRATSIYNTNRTMQILGKQSMNLITANGTAAQDIENVLDAHEIINPSMALFDMFNLGYIYGKKAERARKIRKSNNIISLVPLAPNYGNEIIEKINSGNVSNDKLRFIAKFLEQCEQIEEREKTNNGKEH